MPIACHDSEAMGPMGKAMAPMVSRVGMPRAAMGHARPIVAPMPAHVSALVKAIKAHGMAHGDAMGGHRAGLLINCHARPGANPTTDVLTARRAFNYRPLLRGLA